MGLANVYAAWGERDKADSIYRRALGVYEKTIGPDDSRTPFAQATFWAVAGDKEAALKYLRRAAEFGHKWSYDNAPDFASLKGDEEFEALAAETKKRPSRAG